MLADRVSNDAAESSTPGEQLHALAAIWRDLPGFTRDNGHMWVK
jgi:hypothetical protein